MPRLEAPRRIGKAASSASEMALQCPACPMRFSKLVTRRRHVRTAHPDYVAPAAAPAAQEPVHAVRSTRRTASPACEEWVSCGSCSQAVRTRGELILHVERCHMGLGGKSKWPDREYVKMASLAGDDAKAAKLSLKGTSKRCQWSEHMYVERTVSRCKGAVGRPYLQSVKGDKVKIQKICPATIIVEPRDGAYELHGYWKHVGHDSLPYRPEPSLERYIVPPRLELADKVKAALANVVEDVPRLTYIGLKTLLDKAEKLEQYAASVRETKLEPIEEVILPTPAPPAPPQVAPRKRKLNDKDSSKRDVEKAVDDALEKYIQAKNPVIKLQPLDQSDLDDSVTAKRSQDAREQAVASPKIVNTFSLNEEDDLKDFVKDVEMLVNDGKSFDAVENRSRLGHAGERKADRVETKEPKVGADNKEIKEKPTRTAVRDIKIIGEVKVEPVGAVTRARRPEAVKPESMTKSKPPEVWRNSSFNDTYKDFITKELKSGIPDAARRRQTVNATERDKKLSLEVSAEGINQSDSQLPEEVKNLVKLKRSRNAKNAAEPTSNLNKSVDSAKKSAENTLSKALKSEPAPVLKRLTMEPSLLQEVGVRSRTGLKSKRPTTKPKSKIITGSISKKPSLLGARRTKWKPDVDSDERKPNGHSEAPPAFVGKVKNEEYIVKEQDNDVNILIIRM